MNEMSMDHAITGMARAVDAVMEGKIYGIWLYGSTVLDDYRPGWSDIDFIALADGEISVQLAEKLLMLRQEMLKTATFFITQHSQSFVFELVLNSYVNDRLESKKNNTNNSHE